MAARPEAVTATSRRAALARLAVPLSFLAGALAVPGFAPWGFWPLTLVAFTIYQYLLFARPDKGVRLGLAFGLGMFGLGVNWVRISLHDYGGLGLPEALLLTGLLVIYLSCYPMMHGWLVSRLDRRPLVVSMLLSPVFWVLLEWLRGQAFTGFPWLAAGYSQTDSLLGGLAPLGGVFTVSYALVLTAALLAGLPRLRHPAAFVWSGIGLLVLWGLGWLAGAHEWTEPAGEPVRVSLLQGNIDQAEKWKPEMRDITIARYTRMTRNEWYDGDWGARLVVWPESAIPAFADQVEEAVIRPLIREVASVGGDLLIGVPVLDRTDWRYYNAVMAVTGDGVNYYYKHHLVPFGEFLPLREWLGTLMEVMPLPVADFSAGALDQPLLQVAGQPVRASVCYEIAFGNEIRHGLPEARLLVNVSNDAWFGDSIAASQHFQMARMRALETGRWVLRATNTGITGAIDDKGRVVSRAPRGEIAVVRAEALPMQGSTPYVALGDAFILIYCALFLPFLLQRRQ